MGLDVSAVKGLTKALGNEAFDEHGELRDDEFIQFYHNPDFPGRADDIERKVAYRYEDSEHFFCRSYGGYSNWRNQLAQLAGYPLGKYEKYGESWPSYCANLWSGEITSGPFYELVNFSDCEGVIGTSVSAKLAKDFADFQAKADAHDDKWFRDGYADMRKAFEFASDRGAVEFH